MQILKVTLAILWAALLLGGTVAYLAALILKRPALKRAGSITLGAWLLFDFVLIVLSFVFGWFS
jgi:hypothetical protein